MNQGLLNMPTPRSIHLDSMAVQLAQDIGLRAFMMVNLGHQCYIVRGKQQCVAFANQLDAAVAVHILTNINSNIHGNSILAILCK